MAMQIDPRIVERFKALAGPDVADGLERNGLEGAAEGVLPLWPDCRKIVGPAQTLKLVPPGEGPESAASPPDPCARDPGGAIRARRSQMPRHQQCGFGATAR